MILNLHNPNLQSLFSTLGFKKGDQIHGFCRISDRIL
jgi:hypothetical protein